MSTWLRQSTAIEIAMGPFVDSVDGVTPETALTITQPDIRLKKVGAAWAQKNAAQTLSHEENGWYEVALDTTDTDTLGILIVAIYESGALPVWREFLVVPAAIFDAVIAGETLTTSLADILAAVDTEVADIKADTTAILTDTGTTLDGALSTLQSTATAIKAVTDLLVIASGRVASNVKAIDDSTTAPTALSRSARTMVLATVDAGATTTSVPTSSLVPPAVDDDQFKGRVLLFDKDTTTTALRGQGTRITGSTSGGVLTVDELTRAPASGDTAVIV